MASPQSASPQPKARDVVLGLAIIIVLIAAVIGSDYLPQPYCAIVPVVICAALVVGIASKLRTCLRLAKGSEYSSKVHRVVFWVVLAVFEVVPNLGNLFKTEDWDYIAFATPIAVYLALLYALELVEELLKRGTAGSSSVPDAGTSPRAKSTPNQPLQQTGPA